VNRESPFLSLELGAAPSSQAWQGAVARLLRESPFVHAAQFMTLPDIAEADQWPDTEWRDDEDRDAQGFEAPDGFDAEQDELEWHFEDPASPLSEDQRAWILAPDRSALERLADAAARKRYLEQIDWRGVEFPGNVPKGNVETAAMRRRWRLADQLFSAMATVVPERRVPSSIAYHDPAVETLPGQTQHQLFAEARDAFVRLRDAAAADGVRLIVTSSWRSRKKQAGLSQRQSNAKAVARGRSAHMYGLAVDLRLSVPGLPVAEANTRTSEKMANLVRMYRSPVYKWMALRGREFGWYPYRREPWHWEYNPPGLKARFERAGSPPPVPTTSASGGRFCTFKAQALPITVGVYCPTAALGQAQVEVLLFAHGVLSVCGGPASACGLVQHAPFNLARIIDGAQRPMVLVVPEMDWERHRGVHHPLSDPAALNAVLAEALQEAGRMQGGAAPSLRTLALAGHSLAYAFLGPLARAHARAAMQQGALAKLAEVWALDSTYRYRNTHDGTSTRAWLLAKPGLRVKIAYVEGSMTASLAKDIGRIGHDRLTLIEVPRGVSHCALPVARLPDLLRSFGSSVVDSELDDEALPVDDADEAQLWDGES
jgi:D-alanyl-D-alanine carboxypeptidase